MSLTRWLVLFLSCAYVTAFQQLGPITYQQFITNGVISQNSTILVRCQQSDFSQSFALSIHSSNGTIHNVQVSCSPPTTTYDLTIKGYCPVNGYLTRRQVCVNRDSAVTTPGYNVSFNNYGAFLTPAHGFTTQEHEPHPQYHLMDADPQHLEHMQNHKLRRHLPHNIRTNKGVVAGAAAASFVPVIGPAVGIAILGIFGGGSGGPDQAALKALQGDVTNLQTQAAAFDAALSDFVATQVSANVALNGSINAVKDMAANALTVGQQGLAAANQAVQMNVALSTALANNISNIKNYVASVGSGLLDLTSQVGALSSTTQADIKAIFGNLSSLTNIMNNNIFNLSAAVDANFFQQANQISALASTLRRTIGMLGEVYLNTPARRALTRLVVNSIVDIRSRSSYVPFTGNNGQFPAFQPDNYLTMYVDSIRLLYVDTSLVIHQVDYGFFCNVPWILTQSPGVLSYQDLLKVIGPVNCTLAHPENCYCYVVLNEITCPKATTFNLQSFYNSSSALASSMCAGGTTSHPFTDKMITSGTDLFADFGTRCTLGSTGGTGYAVRSGLMQTQLWVSDDPSVCSLNFQSITSGKASGGSKVNFIFSFLKILEYSYSIASVGLETYTQALDGVLPGNLSSSSTPFATVGLSSASCEELAFMSFGPEPLEAIILASNPKTITDVTISVDGNPYDVFDVAIAVTPGYNVPQQMVFAGDPSYGATFVYDVTADDVPLSGFAEANAGRVTYNMVDDPLKFNMTYWGKKYVEVYNHYSATNVLSAHIKPLTTSVAATCNVPSGTQLGTICQFMQFMQINSFTLTGPNPSMVTSAKTGSYDVQIPIPDGQIFLITNTGCPGVSVNAVSGSAAQVVLNNPVGTNIFVTLVIQGDCNYNFANILVPAGGAYTQIIPTCGVKKGAITATVYKVVGQSIGDACPGGINVSVSVNRTSFLAITGSVDAVYTDQSTQTLAGTTSAAIASLLSESIAIQASLITQVVNQAVLISAFAAVPNLNAYIAITNRTAILAQNMSVILGSINSAPIVNVTTVAAPYISTTQNLTDIAAAAVAAALKSQIAASAFLTNASNSISHQVDTLQTTLDAIHAFTGNISVFAQSVYTTFKSFPQDSGSFFDFMGDVINGVLDLPIAVVNAASKFLQAITNAVIDNIANIAGGLGKLFGSFGGIIGTVIFIGILTCCVGGGGYYLYKKQQKMKKDLPNKFSVKEIDALVQNVTRLNNELEAVKARLNAQAGYVPGPAPAPLPSTPLLPLATPPVPTPTPAASIPTKGPHHLLFVRPGKEQEDFELDELLGADTFRFQQRPHSPGGNSDD